MIDYSDKFKLTGKKAVIFGGCGLLGQKITEALVLSGAKTFVFDINKKIGKKLEKKYRKGLKFIYFDVSRMKDLDKRVENAVSKVGCPDIFINSTYPTTNQWAKSSFSKNKLPNLRKHIDVNLNSSSWLAYKFCEHMRRRKISGSVILMSSIYGLLGQNINLYKNTKMSENMNYSIIKGGIVNLCRQLASYYGQFGLRINSVCPGGVVGHVKGSKANQNHIFKKNYSNFCPMKRLAKPEEIAAAIIFLASDASSYITGTNLMIDGGWSAI